MSKAELVTVTATDALQLPALLFEPEQTSRRMVIWLHGMGSSGIFYGVNRTDALAQALTERQTAFLGLQNRGGGMLQGIKYLDEAGELQRRVVGTTHELIADCVKDIDGAIEFAAKRGYTELYLAGHSTGANKAALYNYLVPENPFLGFVLFGGGDDTGIYFEELGEQHFHKLLDEARAKVKAGQGEELAPKAEMGDYFSYQSIVDILDPDGGYNTFPFFEAQSGTKLATKPLFREYSSISKPMLVLYGENDEYAKPTAKDCLELLRAHTKNPERTDYQLIPGADHGAYQHETEAADAIAAWVSAH